MTQASVPRVTDRAFVANDTSHPVTLIMEPWATEHVLTPGDAAVVEAEGPAGAHAELLVERTCDTAVVWAWAGADARLLARDGRVLHDWARSPVTGVVGVTVACR
jgi:hypothetical protein